MMHDIHGLKMKLLLRCNVSVCMCRLQAGSVPRESALGWGALGRLRPSGAILLQAMHHVCLSWSMASLMYAAAIVSGHELGCKQLFDGSHVTWHTSP